MNQKPPIGIKPRYICKVERVAEIINAIERYSNAGIAIPVEWVEELKDLLDV